MTKRKVKLSTFAMLVAFITIIAVSCSEKATEPTLQTEVVQSSDDDLAIWDGKYTGVVKPSVDGNGNQSVTYNGIADLYGKRFRTEKPTSEDGIIGYIWVQITDAGNIKWLGGLENSVNFDKFSNPNGMPLSEVVINDVVSYSFSGRPLATTLSEQKGMLQVKPNSVTIKFTEGIKKHNNDLGVNVEYNLIEK